MKIYAAVMTLVAAAFVISGSYTRGSLEASREKYEKLERKQLRQYEELANMKMELDETKEINRLLEKTTIKEENPEDPMIATLKKMPCKIDQLRWAARVEGEAGVPPLTLKALGEFQAGNGPEPKLTRRQQRAIVRAYDRHPYPKCDDQRPCTHYMDCDDGEGCMMGFCQEE